MSDIRLKLVEVVEQPKGSFASYVRNTTKTAITLKFPFVQLDRARMSDEHYGKVHTARGYCCARRAEVDCSH